MVTERCLICGYWESTNDLRGNCKQVYKRQLEEGWNLDAYDGDFLSMHRDSWCIDYVPRVIIIKKKV